MSLPSGDIIVTDRVLATTPDIETRLALLCVELGLIDLRHTLDKLLIRALGFAPENTSPTQLLPSARHDRRLLPKRIDAIWNAR